MSPFQWISLALLSLLWVRSLRRWAATGQLGVCALQCLVWTAALMGILWPELTTRLAETVGIGRGADLVLYVFCLAFIWISFLLYGRTLRAERALAELVTQFALVGAVRHRPPGDDPATRDGAPPSRTE
jgi:small membrane protein